jgi:hypothetical protein
MTRIALPRLLAAVFIVVCGACITASVASSAARNTSASQTAASARETTVNDVVYLHVLRRQHLTVTEIGTAYGNFSGPVGLLLEIQGTSMRATFTCRTRSGELFGTGVIQFHVAYPTSTLYGTIAITHGTGHLAHASASRLQVTGTLTTSTYKATFRVRGPMRI